MAIDNRQMLPVGTLLKGGEYRVERYIASGGFGNTYEVEHVRLGKRMALKEFFMRGINQREGTRVSVSLDDNRESFDLMREKFYKEAQRLARLEEEHIVEVNDFFEENATAYYTMRLIDGQSLSALMKQTGRPFSEQQVKAILPQVLSALGYVHANALYHLDLKPGNIMQSANGHCWLIDFGASKQLTPTESQTLSTSTGLCYTPGFAPSEQITGTSKRIGAWTDFYALGATVYNLLTGNTPPSPDDIMNDGDTAFSFPASVSIRMQKLVVWLMQPRAANRPQSVREIEHYLEGGAEKGGTGADRPFASTTVARQASYDLGSGASTVVAGSTTQSTPHMMKNQSAWARAIVKVKRILYIVLSILCLYPIFGIFPCLVIKRFWPQKAKRALWAWGISTFIFLLIFISTRH